jgi:hypothetical protein
MSKHHLRKDNICQNCGHTVPERFCSYCGQENVETRQSFGHLLRHFIEDFTHYEGNFWKTIKYLLFRPAYLTKTYLTGKRVTYVAPVKLYIFISFIAFFIPAVLPDFNEETQNEASRKLINASANWTPDHDTTIHLTAAEAKDMDMGERDTVVTLKPEYASIAEYDSIQSTLPKAKKDGFVTRYFTRKSLELSHLSASQAREKISESFNHNFPKVIFIFLPLFAFVLWLFHGKKKWLYFDHAIFTLHYFAFILLLFTIISILTDLIPWHYIVKPGAVSFVSIFILWFWSVYYYYRAHRKMYEERKIISWLKGSFIFFINSILFILLMGGFLIYTLAHLH